MTQLSKEAKAARAAYIKNWKRKNRARVKEYTRRYWEKKAAENR